MKRPGAIYVITNLEMNHNQANSHSFRNKPIDTRLSDSSNNYIFYITDKNPLLPPLKKVILERDLDSDLNDAGKKFLAEWSFLLAEEKHSFCEYPFFMISSRFYTKNAWLQRDLNEEWQQLFSYFDIYDFAFLPSYCRPMRFFKFTSLMNNPLVFFPYQPQFFALVKELYGIRIPEEYPKAPDLGCHYLGFKNRAALLDYIQFYRPLLAHFFDEKYELRAKITDYCHYSGAYPNEKPITFVLEALSHLYFHVKKKKFFALHYNGYFEVNVFKQKFRYLKKFPLSLWEKCSRQLSGKKHAWFYEGKGRYWMLFRKKVKYLSRKIYARKFSPR